MKNVVVTMLALSVIFVGASSNAQTAKSGYTIVKKIALPESTWWDYLSCDASTGRLFVSRGTMVQVVSLKNDQLIGTIPNTDGVHGIALAQDLGKGFISDGRDSSVTVFNLKTLKVIAKIPVTGRDPDAILYDPFTHRVFTCNGDAGSSTVIDAKTDKVIGTIKLSGSPEFSVTDGHGRIYINIEDNSQIDEINPETMKIENVWPLAPGEHPSGLAIDVRNHILFSVCHNKLMVVVDAKDGKVITTLPIGERVDGASYDPVLKRAYSSNGDGTLTIVQEESRSKFKVLEQFPTQLGARTNTLDPKTHHIFLPTAEFNPPPAATAENPHPRPTMKPNSFVILEVAPAK
jgi:YVTN family beta-propeller protein